MKLLTKALLLAALCGPAAIPASAQNAAKNLPADYLPASFHAGRRQALRDQMPPNSVAVILAYPEQVFSNDVNYGYHANPDMYYFSGYKEPNSMLVVFKDMQQAGNDSYNEILFVRKRDPQRESWTGRRLGVEGAKSQLGFKMVRNSDEMFPMDLKKFSTILYDGLPQDVGADRAKGSLNDLVNGFKLRAGIKNVDPILAADLNVIQKYATAKNLDRIMGYLKPKLELESHKQSAIIQQLVARPDSVTLADVKTKIAAEVGGKAMYEDITTKLRGVKTPDEIALMRKAVTISSLAHLEAMRAVTPNMGEKELEGVIRYVHNRYGAEDEGYPPIVGAGGNGCILHYEENNATRVDNQLVLMDVGAEYHGYSADVTRTFPANGKFTEEQKAIYQIVYNAQEAVFKLCKAGVPYASLEDTTRKIIGDGLMKLGIISKPQDGRLYYTHGVSHHLGLDVHDKGSYSGDLLENMIITVEPGIYIPEGSACDKKWWNIGVRIEDDILIGKDKGTNLSIDAPRTWQAVEKAVAEKSIFDAGKFPALK